MAAFVWGEVHETALGAHSPSTCEHARRGAKLIPYKVWVRVSCHGRSGAEVSQAGALLHRNATSFESPLRDVGARSILDFAIFDC